MGNPNPKHLGPGRAIPARPRAPVARHHSPAVLRSLGAPRTLRYRGASRLDPGHPHQHRYRGLHRPTHPCSL